MPRRAREGSGPVDPQYKPPPSADDVAAKKRPGPIPVLVHILRTTEAYMRLGKDSATSAGNYRAVGVVCKEVQDESGVVKKRKTATDLLEVSPDLYDKLARIAANASAPARNLEVVLFGNEWPDMMDSNGLVDKKFFTVMDRDDDGWYDSECFAHDAQMEWEKGYEKEHGVAPGLCGNKNKADQYHDREQEIFQMCITMEHECTPYHMLCAVAEMQRIQGTTEPGQQALSITINKQGPEGAKRVLAEYEV